MRPGKKAERNDPAALLKELGQWLKSHRPRFAQGLCPGATRQQLDALEQTLGQPLPPSLRTLLTWHNGQNPERFGSLEASWRLLGAESIAATWSDLTAAGDEQQPPWQGAWIPLMDNDAGDFLFLDAGRRGSVPLRAYYLGGPDPEVVAPSLEAWLTEFLASARRGAYVEDPERGAFLRVGE